MPLKVYFDYVKGFPWVLPTYCRSPRGGIIIEAGPFAVWIKT